MSKPKISLPMKYITKGNIDNVVKMTVNIMKRQNPEIFQSFVEEIKVDGVDRQIEIIKRYFEVR